MDTTRLEQPTRPRDTVTRITLREKKQPEPPLSHILAYPMLANMAGRSTLRSVRGGACAPSFTTTKGYGVWVSIDPTWRHLYTTLSLTLLPPHHLSSPSPSHPRWFSVTLPSFSSLLYLCGRRYRSLPLWCIPVCSFPPCLRFYVCFLCTLSLSPTCFFSNRIPWFSCLHWCRSEGSWCSGCTPSPV